MNPKLKELIQVFLDGTKAGVFKWIGVDDEYRLVLDTGEIRINDSKCFVFNQDGHLLFAVDTPGSQSDLARLYDSVHATFQEHALDDLLAEVKKTNART